MDQPSQPLRSESGAISARQVTSPCAIISSSGGVPGVLEHERNCPPPAREGPSPGLFQPGRWSPLQKASPGLFQPGR